MKTVIFGTGFDGQAYLHQTDASRIVCFVDNNKEKWGTQVQGVPVYSLEKAMKMAPEARYVVASRNYFHEIKQQLQHEGISLILSSQAALIEEEFAKRKDKNIVFLCTPEHRNLGDHAIVVGMEDFTRKYFPEYQILQVTDQQCLFGRDELKKQVREDDVLFICGGGFLGTLWMEAGENVVRQIIEDFTANRTVIFPQTMYYSQTKEGNEELEKGVALYSKHQGILMFLREMGSYQFASQHFMEHVKCELAPDIALMLEKKQYEKKKNMLVCLRDDKESCLSEKERIKYNQEGDTFSMFADDFVYPQERRKVIQEKIEELGVAKRVVTDRLHCRILSYIAGSECQWYDNISHKLSGVEHWVQMTAEERGLEFDRMAEKIRTFLSKDYIVYGAGEYFKTNFYKIATKGNFIGIYDEQHGAKDEPLWNDKTPYLTWDELVEKKDKAKVMVAVTNPNACEEIVENLEKHGITYCHMNDFIRKYQREDEQRKIEEFNKQSKGFHGDKTKIVKYIDCYVPMENCNLQCEYCYVRQNRDFRFSKPVMPSPKFIAASFSPERLGGICLINMCGGGETLFYEDIVQTVAEIIKMGHFVHLVTNCTVTKKIDELVALPKEVREHLFVKCSLHYRQLKKKGMLATFTENVHKLHQSGISITVELLPHDELIPEIAEVKEYCLKEFGALCQVSVARDETKKGFDCLTQLSKEEYEKVWGQFDSPMFQLKMKYLERKIEEYCYAGKWSYSVHLGSGDISACCNAGVIGNLYKDIKEPFPVKPVATHCTCPYCYNDHVYITFGVVPSLEAPTYGEMRNRTMKDGGQWLHPAIANIFHQRLDENNGQEEE